MSETSVRELPDAEHQLLELYGHLHEDDISACTNLTRGCRPYPLIENVVTREDFRRQGLGLQVVQQALDIARSRNCYKVMLMTGRKEQGVHDFYKTCGFDCDEKSAYVARHS